MRTHQAPPSLTGGGYFTEVTAWTFMPNLWIDVPLGPPIAWAFGRIPVLEPSSLYTGAGLGPSTVDVTGHVSRGHREQFRLGRQGTLEQPGSTDPFGAYTLSLALRRDAR